MSGLLSILTQGARGLQTAQAWTQTASNNISNANTPGYARQRVDLADLPAVRYGSVYVGQGAILANITQLRDSFIEAQFPVANGNAAASSTQSSVLQSVSSFNADGGISSALSAFYTQLRNLSQDPSNLAYRTAAVGSAQTLAGAFNATATALSSARAGVDTRVEATLPQVNQLAAQVAAYNGQIGAAQASGATPNDLLDARQKAADQLAQLTGAHPIADASGMLKLTLPDGSALVSGLHAATLSTQADPTNGGHDQLMLTQPDGSGPEAVGTISGELGGLLAARDGGLKTAQSQVDQLAFDFAGVINGVHAAGYAMDGSTGRALFTTTATAPGAALGLQVNGAVVTDPTLLAASTSASAPSGDATNVQALINTEATALSTGTNPPDTIANIVSTYGTTTSAAQASDKANQALLGQVVQLRTSTSGVAVDEELVDMQKAQRAYQAMARVIQTTGTMLDTLMSIK